MSYGRPVIVVGAVLALAACGSSGTRTHGPAETTTTTAPSAAPSELAAARSRWEAAGLDTYTLEYHASCGECSSADARIHVSQGKVDEVEPLGEGSRPLALAEAPTVEHLFGEIERATREATGAIEVDYDRITGIPTRVSIDWLKDAVDDEISWTVTFVTPAGTPTSGDS